MIVVVAGGLRPAPLADLIGSAQPLCMDAGPTEESDDSGNGVVRDSDTSEVLDDKGLVIGAAC